MIFFLSRENIVIEQTFVSRRRKLNKDNQEKEFPMSFVQKRRRVFLLHILLFLLFDTEVCGSYSHCLDWFIFISKIKRKARKNELHEISSWSLYNADNHESSRSDSVWTTGDPVEEKKQSVREKEFPQTYRFIPAVVLQKYSFGFLIEIAMQVRLFEIILNELREIPRRIGG